MPKNKGGRPSKRGAKRVLLNLPESTRRMAEMVGEGDRTAGVERLFAQLPVFYKVVIYLEDRAEQGDRLAETLLDDLQGLEYDRIYEECLAEGVIKVGGSYII